MSVKWCLLVVVSVLLTSAVSWSYEKVRKPNYHPYRSLESDEWESHEIDSDELDSHEYYPYGSDKYMSRESNSLESDEYMPSELLQTPIEILSNQYEDLMRNGSLESLDFNGPMFPLKEDPYQNYSLVSNQIDAEFGDLERSIENKYIWQYETDEGIKGKLRPLDLDKHKIKYAIRTFGQCHYCKCGINLQNNRAFGSGLAGRYEYPWMVGIYKKAVAFKQFLCAGTLINDRFVVTGSLCNNGLGVHQLRYSIMEYDLKAQKDQSFIRKATAVYKPTHYLTFPGSRDIALHKLRKRVPIGWGLLRPICLPSYKFVYKGRQGVVAGWGGRKPVATTFRKLHTARLTVLSNKRCNQLHPAGVISSYQLCTTRSTRAGVCAITDRGSPLMLKNKLGRYFLAGITQYYPYCNPTYKFKYILYTKIGMLRYFILRLTSGACTCRL